MHFRGSDEHTESLTNTLGEWSVGIGSFDMNEGRSNYDELRTGYDVWRSEDNRGFSFVLLDRSVEKITFLVAWIKKSPKTQIDYEAALDFWLT